LEEKIQEEGVAKEMVEMCQSTMQNVV